MRDHMYTREKLEEEVGQQLPFEKVFAGNGETFGAVAEAKKWLYRFGFDVGSMQREAPIGIARNADIAKWHNLGHDRKLLDGAMVSNDWREGSVTVYLAFDPTATPLPE
jgi:hypothetical protein